MANLLMRFLKRLSTAPAAGTMDGWRDDVGSWMLLPWQ
jgi:hypothetical protein